MAQDVPACENTSRKTARPACSNNSVECTHMGINKCLKELKRNSNRLFLCGRTVMEIHFFLCTFFAFQILN